MNNFFSQVCSLTHNVDRNDYEYDDFGCYDNYDNWCNHQNKG